MAEVNVENMEENAALFVEKMGFGHDADGLDMTDDQLVNFLLLCHQTMMGVDGEDDMYEDVEEERMEVPCGYVKVKVRKRDAGNVDEILGKLLGGH